MSTRIEVEIVTDDRVTRMEQEFSLELTEAVSISGGDVIRDERPDIEAAAVGLAADAARAHRRIS